MKNGDQCNWGQNCLYLHIIISNETSQSEENLIVDITTKSITHTCDVCETTFNCASYLNDHNDAMHERNSCQGTVEKLLNNCDQCPVVYDNSNDLLLLQDSEDTHHGSGEDTGPVYVCEICDMSYNCDSDFSEHNINIHINYSCDQCDFVSYGKMMMQYHPLSLVM